MPPSHAVADAIALGVVSGGLGLTAFCLGLDPRPVWGGEERPLAGDGLFFLPFYALVAACLGGVARLGAGLVPGLVLLFPLASGGMGYGLRFLYASHRSGAEKLVWVLGLAAALAYLPWVDLSGALPTRGWL